MAGKGLAWGYTTGTCAQAATKAAAIMLLETCRMDSIQVTLPNGKILHLDVEEVEAEYENGQPCSVSCAVKKDSGDDPDITNGVLVYSKVAKTRTGLITVDGGKGIGRVTKPGLEQPVGNAAINRVPRRMIQKEAEAECKKCGYTQGLSVVISIPQGEELAKKTFNPRLGIEGGLSVLGTSGIVEPMSEQALIETIRLEMKVKINNGDTHIVAAPGNYGLNFLEEEYGIPPEKVIKCSNYIGQTVDMAAELGCRTLLLAGHIGKLVKVAGGIMNTHSRWADSRMEILASAALRAGLPGDRALSMLESVTGDEALSKCSDKERKKVMQIVMQKIQEYLLLRAGDKMEVGTIVFSNVYGILGKSENAERMIHGS